VATVVGAVRDLAFVVLMQQHSWRLL